MEMMPSTTRGRSPSVNLSSSHPGAQGSSPIMPQVSLAPPSLCPALPPLLRPLLPSLPPTLRDADVPPPLRRRFILSGYRPAALPWRCYLFSLLQLHNETLSAWSPLLAAAFVSLRFLMFAVLQGGGILGFRLQGPEGQGFSVDAASLPLVLYFLSAVTYLSCSTLSHLLRSRSAQTRRSLSLLQHVGVSIHLFACAVALCLYSSDAVWKQSILGKIFLPGAALLSWFTCVACCFAELHLHPPLHRKVCQVCALGVAYLLVISPIAHRLTTHSWTSALTLHFLQVVLFLLSFLFLSSPIPECFSPGRCDIIGHSRQLSCVLSSLGVLLQQEALCEDFLWRRAALIREFGEQRLLLVCCSVPGLALCCVMAALALRKTTTEARLEKQEP